MIPPKIDRILLATDLSARSDRALRRSVLLARAHGARLNVLHVVDEELPASVCDRLAEAAEAEIAAGLDAVMADGAVDAAVHVRIGVDHRDILGVAAETASDLIVLGRHRDETGVRTFSGTTVERVLRNGVHPVLVVSGRADGPYRRITAGIDFSVFSLPAIRAAFTFGREAEIAFVHAYHVPFEGFLAGSGVRREVAAEYEDRLAALTASEAQAATGEEKGEPGAAQRIERVVRNGEVTTVLREEAARTGSDLLILGTHGRAGLANAILGSVAEDLLNRPVCDTLVVRAW